MDSMGIRILIHVLVCLLLLMTCQANAAIKIKKIPRLSVFSHEQVATNLSSNILLHTNIDHFNYRPESYATYQQRYIVNSKYWGGGGFLGAPIFAYLGAEASIDHAIGGIGILTENAARFKALLVYIEHRYYGESIPFRSREEAMSTASTKGYFNSAQALADYAEIIISLKKNLAAESSPVIVFGGSYGGMLAAWFRLKYPHVAIGALASSAPVLYLDDLTPEDAYYTRVSKDFKDVSQTCYDTIKQSWSEIARVASSADGLSSLSQQFNSCTPITSVAEVEEYLTRMYSAAAQYDSPPNYPVSMVCKGIDDASHNKDTDVLGRIFAGIVSYRGEKPCYDLSGAHIPTETEEGWGWQSCSEIVMNIGVSGNDRMSMFYPSPYDLDEFMQYCNAKYGVTPRPHWITTYYGGHHIKEVLKKFASNIIFSNGLRDPYSTAGVLEDISESVIALKTEKGSHCLDIVNSKQTDPRWLVMQRNIELENINGWILNYYKEFSRD